MRHARYAVLGLLLVAGTAAAQDILFFEQPDFNGRRFGASYSVSNMSDQGFNDRAQSIVVRAGAWQLCTESYFRGRCVTLSPGEYRNLSQVGLAYQISSARQLGGGTGGATGGGSAGGTGDAITLFEDFNFGGRSLGFNGAMPNLGRAEFDFNDRARSMIIQSGNWELCRDDNFRGGCQVHGPGRIANLGGLAGEVTSFRPVGGGGGGGPGGGTPPDGWGSQGRVILYEYPGFGGRSYPLAQDMVTNFSGLGFNDRASSIRVERGYWMFCSDSEFRGTCRTFGPGDYPQLDYGIDKQISSGRRIHNEYPYKANPNWGGYTQQ